MDAVGDNLLLQANLGAILRRMPLVEPPQVGSNDQPTDAFTMPNV